MFSFKSELDSCHFNVKKLSKRFVTNVCAALNWRKSFFNSFDFYGQTWLGCLALNGGYLFIPTYIKNKTERILTTKVIFIKISIEK